MPSFISHLRRWVAGAAIAFVLLVAGAYFYARHRVQNALKQVPEKMGLEIQQSATGFTVSKSDQGRTVFKIQASRAIQFKGSGHAELHDVSITLYGRDSSRFDQIYGSDFEYDQQSGNITAKGEVQIDLEANPGGITSADQAPPKELKNPLHLQTSGLVFNQKTGNAYTNEKVEFRLPQASGSAQGVHYVAKSDVFTLDSDVNLVLSGPVAATITANRATITKDPRLVVLGHPHLVNGAQHCDAEEALLFLRADNTLDHVVARGNVVLQAEGLRGGQTSAEELDLFMAKERGMLQTAVFSGNVHAETRGIQPMQANAGRVTLEFFGKNLLHKVRAQRNVKLVQHQNASGTAATSQDLELTAGDVDFFFKDGSHLNRAETTGEGQIAIRPASHNGQETLASSRKFDARFDDAGQLSAVHGEPDARIVSRNPGQPDRVSTSEMLDATFQSGHGIQSLMQQGRVAYTDGDRKAWGDRARYTPVDQVLVLAGSPRVVEGGMTTTARAMRLDRRTGDAQADGDVKTTYSDLLPQPGGALLSSASPIHVTAQSMTVHGSAATALYSGDARLWQDANIVEAPSIEFDRSRRSMVAHASEGRGSSQQTVSTVLVQTDKSGKSTPVHITSARLSYSDRERRAHFDGDVVAKGADLTITAKEMNVFLHGRDADLPSDQANPPPSQAGKLEKIVALGQVVVSQPERQANGDQLVYSAGEDLFVLTGGPPSIFDAEHGKITGVLLTFFRHDDRVLVEGNNSSPTVTKTRVAR